MGFDSGPHWLFPRGLLISMISKAVWKTFWTPCKSKDAKFSKTEDIPYLHPGKASQVVLDHEVFGGFRKIHPKVLASMKFAEGFIL